ncbi:Nn.00g103070.m01.CDS01 [Neocucurbitaria sp. VM-36]
MLPSPFLHGLSQKKPSTPASPGSTAHDSELATLNKRYEQFVLYDQEKSKFMGELVARYEYLHQQYQIMASERDREHGWIMSWQAEKQQYEKWIKNMQRAMADNPFVMVLIDGDGMIFLDEFLREGEQGGRRAAAQLSAAIQNYIETEADIPLGARIVCRIYANVRGLGDVLVRTGAIEEIGQFQDFVRGFTRGKTLFDFIDVGGGKDRADEKIIESFKLFSQDYHCRRVLFGCSHDNGYARALEECSDKAETLDKVILLEGVPFEKELISLPYSTKKFPGIFRESKIVLWGNAFTTSQPCTPLDSGSPGSKTFSMLSGLPTRFPPPRVPVSALMDSPIPAKASMMNLPRTPSSSTLASDGFPALKPAPVAMNSWAAKAAAPAPSVSESPAYKPTNREEVIARNRAGQRVDPPCKDYDKAEVDRIKKIKMCNVHFLRNECPYDANCTHLHEYKPTKDEISTLRLVARMAPCQNGSGCQDIKCIYGHRCPAPPHKTHQIPGTKSCIFGESCKFPPDLHDVDTNVVKTLVIR